MVDANLPVYAHVATFSQHVMAILRAFPVWVGKTRCTIEIPIYEELPKNFFEMLKPT